MKFQDSSGAYVDLRLEDASLVDDIIPNDIFLKNSMVPISLEQQKKELSKKVGETETPTHDDQNFAFAIAPSSMIRITAYDNGVKSFYVRFKSKSDQCRNFILKVQSMRDNLIPLRLDPKNAAINTLCIALYDCRLYRSRIVEVGGNLPSHLVIVQLLETGERLRIKAKQLFKMPSEISTVPPFARHMKLANFDIVPPLNNLLVDFYFHFITNQKTLALKFVEDNGETSPIQSCELFDNGESVVDMIRSWKFMDLEYAPQPNLKKDVDYRASIVSGNSPENFFILIIDESFDSKYKELDKINEIETPNLKNPTRGSACLVKNFSGVQRAKIITNQNPFYGVQFVDVGNEDDIGESELRVLLEKHAEIPPLAYQCSLKEFVNEIVDAQTIKIFEKILDSCEEFVLTVHDRNEKHYLVNLVDPREKKSIYEMISE